MANSYIMTEFIFLRLSPNQEVQRVCFVIFMLLYMAIVLGNSLIVLTVMTSRSLGSPMYFFLSYLSFLEICYSSTTAPKLISDLLAERKTISWWGCMTQLFFMYFFGGIKMFVLTVMAYDRLCGHLQAPQLHHHHENQQACMVLVGTAWVRGFVHSFAQIILIFQLPFCGPNVIDHYFCDVLPMIQLACSDTFFIGLLIVANRGTISVISFVVLLVSYVVILLHLRTLSSEGQCKALSTCGSHITVVVLFFCTLCLYLRPSTTLPADKMVAVFYTVITPFLNPIIYSLKNAEVKKVMKRMWIRTVKLDEKQRLSLGTCPWEWCQVQTDGD